jgi:F-type H+-transporting ATPase subunit epsilon
MHVTVISPESTVFEGGASTVVAPAYDGLVGILPGHAPFVTLLGDGILTIRADAAARSFHVRHGFLQVEDDTVRVVAEQAEEEKGVQHGT